MGTTSCRTVESASTEDGILQAKTGWTDIFIYPGYKFKILDALITNFHLPESTLVMLVSALAGRENILAAYNEAIRERYRFFSFGDAMLIMDLKTLKSKINAQDWLKCWSFLICLFGKWERIMLDLYHQLVEYCAKNGMSKAEAVRKAIVEMLDK